VLLTGTPL
jgi:SNF2 family DNA or RNA helicase